MNKIMIPNFLIRESDHYCWCGCEMFYMPTYSFMVWLENRLYDRGYRLFDWGLGGRFFTRFYFGR